MKLPAKLKRPQDGIGLFVTVEVDQNMYYDDGPEFDTVAMVLYDTCDEAPLKEALLSAQQIEEAFQSSYAAADNRTEVDWGPWVVAADLEDKEALLLSKRLNGLNGFKSRLGVEAT